MEKNKDKKVKPTKATKGKTESAALKSTSGITQEKFDALQKKHDEVYDSLLRATAEIENIKKRSQKEIENIYKFSNESIIQELVPIYESLDLSLKIEGETTTPDKIKEGNKILLSMFEKLFEKNNIKIINPLKEQFNPDYHQAISTKADESLDDNLIVEVVQKGYILNERVIKPALVVVIKNT